MYHESCSSSSGMEPAASGAAVSPEQGPTKEAWDRRALKPALLVCMRCSHPRHWTQPLCNMITICSVCLDASLFFHCRGRTGGGGGFILAHDLGFAFAGAALALLLRPGVKSPAGTGACNRLGFLGTGCAYKRPAGKASR